MVRGVPAAAGRPPRAPRRPGPRRAPPSALTAPSESVQPHPSQAAAPAGPASPPCRGPAPSRRRVGKRESRAPRRKRPPALRRHTAATRPPHGSSSQTHGGLGGLDTAGPTTGVDRRGLVRRRHTAARERGPVAFPPNAALAPSGARVNISGYIGKGRVSRRAPAQWPRWPASAAQRPHRAAALRPVTNPRELTGFFPRIDRIFPSSTSKRYLRG